VPHARRFSTSPRLEDVAEMELDPGDVEAIRRCVPGNCEVKLAAGEIARLRQAQSVQREFRRLIVDRVNSYLERGLRAAEPYHDHVVQVDPAQVGSRLLTGSPWLTLRAPSLARYIDRFPALAASGVDSFLYWLDTTQTPKRTIQVVHVAIARRQPREVLSPEAVVVSRQIFASHYINGSLAVSVLLFDPASSRRYLVYFNRVHVDGLDGWLGGLRRLLVERAAKRRGAAALDEQRKRIEAWPEPASASR
jgi:hypothetical protein